MRSFIRTQRIESKLTKVVVDALIKLDVDGCIISKVEVSRDFRRTKVYYLVQKKDDAEAVATRLKVSKGSIVREMMKNFNGRAFPKIDFFYDSGAEATARINALLDAIPDIQ